MPALKFNSYMLTSPAVCFCSLYFVSPFDAFVLFGEKGKWPTMKYLWVSRCYFTMVLVHRENSLVFGCIELHCALDAYIRSGCNEMN